MYLIPLVRAGRAATCSLLFPEYQIEMIAISEIVSYSFPFLNFSSPIFNMVGFTIYLIYDREYAIDLMNIYKNEKKIIYNIEFLLLYIYLLNILLYTS
jgi:hypothetical protein